MKSKFIIPEGPIDYYLLHAIIGIARDKHALSSTIGIVPAKNAGDVVLLTTLYQTLEFDSIGLLDGDAAGNQVLEAAQKKGLDKLVRLISSKELLSVDFMESLFDYKTYVMAASEAHGLKEIDRKKIEAEGPPTDNNFKRHIQSYFAKHSLGQFSGLQTAAQLANQFDALNSNTTSQSLELVEKARGIVASIHKLFKIRGSH